MIDESKLKAADTRRARVLLSGWGYEPSPEAIKEVSAALTDTRQSERARCATLVRTVESSRVFADDQILRNVILAAIRWTGETRYVVAVDGDGAMCLIVPERDLHSTVHALLCTCGSDWDNCETEGISAICATLDHDDAWTMAFGCNS